MLNEDTTRSRQAHSKYHAYEYSDHGLRTRLKAILGAPHLDSNLQVKSTIRTTTPRTWPWPWPWPWPSAQTGQRKDIKRKGRRLFCYSEKKHREPWQTMSATTTPTRGYSPCVPHSRCHRYSEDGGVRSGAARYGTKKAIEAAKRKKRMGKNSAAQWRPINDRSSKCYV